MIITSKSNPLVKQIYALKDKKGRREQGCFIVEGRKMVSECLKSGMKIDKVIASIDYDGDLFSNTAIRVSADIFKYLSDEKTPQGLLCTVKIPAEKIVKPTGSCLVLDGISDPGNMGAIIRTANAAGYRELYLIECTDAYSPKSVRASMSGIFFVKLYIGSREQVLSFLEDTPLLVADMDGTNIFKFNPPDKFALAIGNEANGISEELFNRASYTISIPMTKEQESLNAAVSAGIAMYTLKRGDFTK